MQYRAPIFKADNPITILATPGGGYGNRFGNRFEARGNCNY